MPRSYRRRWDETRGDAYDSWGPAVYYFEVSNDWHTVRHMEVYNDGHVLRYGPDHPADDYGFLSADPGEPDDFEPYEIDQRLFEDAWSSGGTGQRLG